MTMVAPATAGQLQAEGTRVAVIGAGRMGMSLAQWLAFSGVPVTLCSRHQESLQSFRHSIEKHFAGKARRGRMSEAERRQSLESVRTVQSHEELEDADFVIECVVEDLAVKRALFQELGRGRGGERILCSNTSSLPVSEIARDAVHPDRIVGTHFFQPVRFTSVVEIVPGRETGSETVARVEKLLRGAGKTPVRVQDCPGFLVNRILAAYLLAAARMAREGVASPERIDRALRDWGMQLGPFEIMKLVGVDLVLQIARGLSAAYGERFRFDDVVEGLDPGSWLAATPGVDENQDGNGSDESIVERALLPLVEEAQSCLREGVASAEDMELAAVACLRMPKGPLALARERGIEASLPARPRPASAPHLDVQIEQRVAIVTLKNPPANSLTSRLMEDFLRLLDGAELDSVSAVVIVGAGRVFSAGVDPMELGGLRSAEEGYLRSRHGQELLERIEGGSKLMIAAINGLCLGGGLELALACHFRFCSDRARLGLPEVQLGLIPGLGGTQRLPRLVGLSRALDLVLIGDTIKAERALQIGLVDRIVSRNEVLDEARGYARRLARRDPSVVAAVLRTLRDGARLPMEAGLELEAETFGRLAEARIGPKSSDGTRARLEWQFVDEHGGRHEHGEN